MFLFWQLLVCASIVAAGRVSRSALRVVVGAWTLWTLFVVFPTYPVWVGMFQLLNAFVTWFVMESRKLSRSE